MPASKRSAKQRILDAFRSLASLPPKERLDVYKSLRDPNERISFINGVPSFNPRIPADDLFVDESEGIVRLRPPRVFLSHSSADKPLVRMVGDELRRSGIKVWIDEIELEIGDSLLKKLSNGIANSDFIIAFISPASVASEWVSREIELATLREFVTRQVVVLSVLLQNAKMPSFMEGKKYADFRDPKRQAENLNLLVRAVQAHFTNR